MPRFALVLMSLLLALTLGCSPQPPSKPAAPVAPSVGATNPLDRPAPPRPIGATPSSPDRSCKTDADCTVKNVGNCCGYFPACVNKDSAVDPAAVRAECERTGTSSVCGWQDIQACTCTQGQCRAVSGPLEVDR